MHELSICGAIADIAADHANGRQVRRIELRIGHLRQVVPETLQWCWDAHTRDGPFEGCALAVDHVPAVLGCAACGEETVLAGPVLRCGACHGTDARLMSGDEFLIVSIDVADNDAHYTGFAEEVG